MSFLSFPVLSPGPLSTTARSSSSRPAASPFLAVWGPLHEQALTIVRDCTTQTLGEVERFVAGQRGVRSHFLPTAVLVAGLNATDNQVVFAKLGEQLKSALAVLAVINPREVPFFSYSPALYAAST